MMQSVILRDFNLASDIGFVYFTGIGQMFPHPALFKYGFTEDDIDVFKDTFIRGLNFSINLFKIFLLDDVPLGFIMSYDHKNNDRHAKIFICTLSNRWNLFGDSLLMSYLNLLFMYYDLRKVYIESTPLDKNRINFLKQFGFIEEMCLKDYYTLDGTFVDKLYYSITRESFIGYQ